MIIAIYTHTVVSELCPTFRDQRVVRHEFLHPHIWLLKRYTHKIIINPPDIRYVFLLTPNAPIKFLSALSAWVATKR